MENKGEYNQNQMVSSRSIQAQTEGENSNQIVVNNETQNQVYFKLYQFPYVSCESNTNEQNTVRAVFEVSKVDLNSLKNKLDKKYFSRVHRQHLPRV